MRNLNKMKLTPTLSSPKINSHILAIDIGGTKIGYGLVPIRKNSVSFSTPILFKGITNTIKGKEALAEKTAEILAICQKFANKNHIKILPYIAVASPGKFIGNKKEIIAPNTAINLELFSGEFANLNLIELLTESIPNSFQIKVINDAVAQMVGGINLITNKSNLLINKKICYIGPGTGLGGGFCEVNSKQIIKTKTDGHIFDLKILDSNNQQVKAEDVFCGTAFERITNYSPYEVEHDKSLFIKKLSLKKFFLRLFLGDC